MRNVWIAIVSLLLACQRDPAERPSAQSVAPSSAPSVDRASPPADDGGDVGVVLEPAESSDGVEIGDWGISIVVPPGATSAHEAEANRHTVTLAPSVVVKLYKVATADRDPLADAKQNWNHGEQLRALGDGTTPSGVVYAIRSFRVRIGFEGMPGQHIHTYKRVSRVYALLVLDDATHLTCTGYVEHEVESARDPDIEAVRKICLSMRQRAQRNPRSSP